MNAEPRSHDHGGLIDFIQYLPGHELKINSHFNHACTQCTELMLALTFE